MISFRSKYFPRQLFLRFVVVQLLLLLLTLFIAALLARAHLARNLPAMQTVQETVALFDRTMISLSFFAVLVIGGITFWTGYRLVLPLGRMMLKARSIQKRDYAQAAREEEAAATEAEPSEWSELETTLHKIGKEMQNRDRTFLREREQVEAVMSALSEAVVAIDKQGGLLFFNSRFAVMFGSGRPDSRLSDIVRSPDILEAFRATVKDGASREMGTHIRLPGEETARYFSLSLAPLRQDDQDLYGAIGVFHDLTEIKRTDQIRIDFVANVSHELRTPLTVIKGYAQTLKDDLPPDAPSHNFVETIERNADRLIALVNDLLNLSSLESGAEIERENVSLPELTARVLAQLEKLRATKGHELQSEIKVQTLLADPKRVEQVLYNLLENAIKYVPAKGKILVEWLPIDEGLQLAVTDNGPGISPDHQPRIFERFYRIDGARSRDQGGTGLGLAIVKHIMQRHGGKISVYAAPNGQGARFVCTFPQEFQS